MEITNRAAHWTAPKATPCTGVCMIAANHALGHSHPNKSCRKTAPAVSTCETTKGQLVLLCSHCASYVEVLRWLARIGYADDVGVGQLAALAYVWRAVDGFVMPLVESFSGSYQALGMVAHHLNKLIRVGLVKRIGDRYLIRDACPSCFRRVCSEECKLHFGGEFAPRRESTCLHGT